MNATTASDAVSLLWPAGAPRRGSTGEQAWHEQAIADLGLTEVAQLLSIDPRYTGGIRSILLELCGDPAVIVYRQEVLDNLLSCPELAQGIENLLPSIVELTYYVDSHALQQSALHQALRRLSELEMYVDCIKRLGDIFRQVGGAVTAEGLLRLRRLVDAIEADENFRVLAAELPALGEEVRAVSSVTIGVNLNAQLLPVEATLVSVNAQRYKGASGSLLGKLLGRKADEFQGIAQLHGIAARPGAGLVPSNVPENPLLVPLFKDLNDVLAAAARVLIAALKRYIQINGQFLVLLVSEFAFYLGALRMVRLLRESGLPVCRPEAAPADERVCRIEGSYNLGLAFRLRGKHPNEVLGRHIVANDVAFGPEGRIFILTGPNRGGKTTYTQAVGVAQVLFQAGLCVPGAHARISPVDAIYTHFQGEEKPGMDAGRLGEEAKRLSDIFARATRRSLILLNESLSSTSPAKACTWPRMWCAASGSSVRE